MSIRLAEYFSAEQNLAGNSDIGCGSIPQVPNVCMKMFGDSQSGFLHALLFVCTPGKRWTET